MLNFDEKPRENAKVLNLTLDGFEGPIDLLLNLVRDQKIDITKIQILPLAEQYLDFLKSIIKKDLDVAAEYLVIGAVLAYIKSKSLIPRNVDDEEDPETLSELLRLQILKLETFQKLSKSLISRKQLGINFFGRGENEVFTKNIKYKHSLSLYNLTKSYTNILAKEKESSMRIAYSKIFTVEQALKNLKDIILSVKSWQSISYFIPKEIKNYLEYKAAYASYFVATLELSKAGELNIKENKKINNLEIKSNIKL